MPSRLRGGRRLRPGLRDPGRTSRAGELSCTVLAPGGLALPPCAPCAGAFLLSSAFTERTKCFYATERRRMANAEKVAAVAELTERFNSSSGAVLTEYRGLTVAQLAELRRSLADNATFAVVKNTLTKIAVTEAGLSDQLSPLLAGPSAVAFVDGDVVEAAKGLRDFAKANPLLVIKGGVLDGKAISPSEIIKLADLEPREVLLAKLAGAMKASLAGAAATFNALPVQMAQLAEALRAKRAAASDAVPADAVPADAVPADAVPADAVAADAVPADAVPADAVPADAVPADAVPAGTGPAGTGPAGTGPAGTGPAGTGTTDTGTAEASSDATP